MAEPEKRSVRTTRIPDLEACIETLTRERDDYKHAAGAEAQLFNEARAALTAAGEERDHISTLLSQQIDRTEAAEDRVKSLEGALRESAERLHGLSEDPVHLGHIFADCSAHECVAARAALEGPG